MYTGPIIFFSADGLFTNIRIPQVRASLSRQLPCAQLLVLGSIPLHSLCTTNLPREFTRH